MRKSTTLTQFIQELSVIIDSGVVFSIEEVNNQIVNKNVINWLENEVPFEKTGVDFSIFEPRHRNYIHESLLDVLEGRGAGNELRKWGIKNNGLCLLISWTTELIRKEFSKDGFID